MATVEKVEELIQNRKRELEKLSDEKEKILDWVHSQEKAVDALRVDQQKLRDQINFEKNGLEQKRNELIKLKDDLAKEKGETIRLRSETQVFKGNVDLQAASNKDMSRLLNEREIGIGARELNCKKREDFIKEIFNGLDKLRG